MPDPICPTFAAGTFSIISDGGVFNTLADSVSATGVNGYTTQAPCETVGSFNTFWTNGCHTQTVQPTFSTTLLSFGATGRQS